jgi:hypothetical protein
VSAAARALTPIERWLSLVVATRGDEPTRIMVAEALQAPLAAVALDAVLYASAQLRATRMT